MAEGSIGGWLAQRLSGARRDAARIASELVSRGSLSAEEAAALERAVQDAVVQGRDLLAAALREPRRIVAALRGSGARVSRAAGAGEGPAVGRDGELAEDDPGTATERALLARLDRIEARLNLLERALHARGREALDL